MSRGVGRRSVATATGLAALAALAVSLGVHPAVVLEIAAVIAVLLAAASLLRLVPGTGPRPGRRAADTDSDPWTDAHGIVAGSLRSRWWVDTALRPVVREIVEARLAADGRPLPDDPGELRRILPTDVAELVAHAGRGADRGPLTPAQLDTLLDHLEELSP